MKKSFLIAAVVAATGFGAIARAAETPAPAATGSVSTPADPSTAVAPAPKTTVAVVVLERGKPGDKLTSKIVGAPVYSTSGDRVGSVDDLIVDAAGKITGVVVGVGGFLGVGEKTVALAYDAVTLGTDDKGKPKLTAPVTKQSLEAAASFVPADKS